MVSFKSKLKQKYKCKILIELLSALLKPFCIRRMLNKAQLERKCRLKDDSDTVVQNINSCSGESCESCESGESGNAGDSDGSGSGESDYSGISNRQKCEDRIL